MRALTSAFVIALLLASCGTAKPALQNSSVDTVSEEQSAVIDGAEPLFKSEQDLPRLDGSTANIPLATLILSRTAPMMSDEIANIVKFSTTPNAYENLIDRDADFLLAYEADEATKEIIKKSTVELEYHAIGKDALVFLANLGNPISSLTTQQIQDIYQGKITNWKSVGGEDIEIAAYQRSERSGSQALMVKLVMKDLTLMKAPTQFYPAEMGGLIEALGEYNNSKNAIGYSVYYYAKNMYAQPGLKFLSVDGIPPDNDTISSSAYPFINDFYAVIRKSEPADSPARKMLQWVLSDEGKKTITDAGYVPIS